LGRNWGGAAKNQKKTEKGKKITESKEWEMPPTIEEKSEGNIITVTGTDLRGTRGGGEE